MCCGRKPWGHDDEQDPATLVLHDVPLGIADRAGRLSLEPVLCEVFRCHLVPDVNSLQERALHVERWLILYCGTDGECWETPF